MNPPPHPPAPHTDCLSPKPTSAPAPASEASTCGSLLPSCGRPGEGHPLQDRRGGGELRSPWSRRVNVGSGPGGGCTSTAFCSRQPARRRLSPHRSPGYLQSQHSNVFFHLSQAAEPQTVFVGFVWRHCQKKKKKRVVDDFVAALSLVTWCPTCQLGRRGRRGGRSPLRGSGLSLRLPPHFHTGLFHLAQLALEQRSSSCHIFHFSFLFCFCTFQICALLILPVST